MMPEMTGMELYAELARRAPDQVAKVVFLTGGAFTPAARAFLERTPIRASRSRSPCPGCGRWSPIGSASGREGAGGRWIPRERDRNCFESCGRRRGAR